MDRVAPRRYSYSMRPPDAVPKLSFEDTAREMAAAAEDWSEWETTVGDGIDDLTWEVHQPTNRSERTNGANRRSR